MDPMGRYQKPKPVQETQHDMFLEQEAYPDRWFRQSYYQYLDESRRRIADFISASVDDVVLVENASSAVNSILRSIPLKRGDKVIRLSTSYGMVVHTLEYLVETIGIEIIVVEVNFPMTGPDQMIDALKETLNKHDVKLCIFSHISSFPAVVEPLKELVSVIRSSKSSSSSSMILVDGAHAPGQIPNLNVPSYGVDFYLGNCHKWLYAPKGTAFLWVAPTRQSLLEPTVISSLGKHDFVGKYSYTGTRDYTGFATLPSAFNFRTFLGGDEQIYDYCHTLAVQAGTYLANAWNTRLLVPENMSGYMVNVILPSQNELAITKMQEILDHDNNIYIVVGAINQTTINIPGPSNNNTSSMLLSSLTNNIQNENCHDTSINKSPTTFLYVTRLSAQVYLDMDDFTQLGSLVPDLLKKIEEEEGELELSSVVAD